MRIDGLAISSERNENLLKQKGGLVHGNGYIFKIRIEAGKDISELQSGMYRGGKRITLQR